MRGLSLVGLLALTCFTNAAELLPRNYDANDYYVLHIDAKAEPAEIAKRLGLSHEGQLGELEDHHIFSTVKREDDPVQDAIKARRKLRKRGSSHNDVLDAVKLAQKQRLKPRMEKRGIIPTLKDEPSGVVPARQLQAGNPVGMARQAEVARILGIRDPIFNDQWHLYNNLQLGHDVNVTDVWIQGITGHNATVAIVDDGLDMYSDDLKENYFAEGSYDFNDQSPEPKPKLADDRHGTRCAGEVGAAKNNVCGVGVAYNSKIAGIRILSKLITDADEAIALNYAYQRNQIYSCSWGPPDDGRSMDAPGILIKRAMLNAIQKGRGGLGSVYVFASGNGASSEDNCNFDGYTNSIYSITVGAVDRRGDHPYYSEKCSAQLVVTYSSGGGDNIVTTDVGANNCATTHGGTSAAAPLAAGIFALVLSIRPDLTWRDMQSLAMQTAVTIDSADDWQTTTIGKKFSHTFGYGKIDTWAIVEGAKTFKSLKPQAWYYSPWIKVNKPIPQGDQGLAVTYDVTAEMLKEANLERLEHVTVTMNVEHERRGDLSLDLISPDNLVSHLSATRKFDDSKLGYADWTFMSVVHWYASSPNTYHVSN
jgi:kexin